jgi:poly(A) polymerase
MKKDSVPMTAFSGKMQPQAWMLAPETQKIMEILRTDGGDARFVGGCVRNALANRKITDIDIATPLLPEQVIERLKHHKIAHAPVGLKHGTVTAIVEGHPFEITTLRLDIATYGRHADVKFTDDWKADAARRDFTINAIFMTVDGDIDDPFGGVTDLRLGRVRFVGDAEKRIREDYLRILRFFRFYAHFGKEAPDAAALKACAAAAAEIRKLSPERIRQETLKLLESDHCPSVWQMMLHAGVVTHFLPEATNVRALENLVQLEAHYECPAFALRRLAAVLEVTMNGLINVVKGLKLSNEQGAQLLRMVDPRSAAAVKTGEAMVKKLVYKLGNDMVRNILLLEAARSGEKNDLAPLYQVATSFRPPLFPLRGEDVLASGLKPGPEIGRVLAQIEEWWLGENFIPGRTECLQKLLADLKSSGA